MAYKAVGVIVCGAEQELVLHVRIKGQQEESVVEVIAGLQRRGQRDLFRRPPGGLRIQDGVAVAFVATQEALLHDWVNNLNQRCALRYFI